ncbi:Plasmodesmata-located protein 2, partial [Linum perenne]
RRTLSVLYQQLLSQSSHSNFFKSTAGDANLGISGLFQCRSDLGNDDCRRCVGAIPATSDGSCSLSVAARVQLSGCYLRYETEGFPAHWPPEEGGGGGGHDHDHDYELLHKKCDSKEDDSEEFKTAREAVFAAVEREVEEGGGGASGFCEKEIEHVKIEAECERDLKGDECGECVKEAAEIAEEKCGDSVSGEVYLDKCFLSYSYDSEESSGGSKSATAKIIALAAGGTAAFVGLIVLLKFLKSRSDKDDDTSDC